MDELQISGKLYISAKRAAKKHGYHADYIGQLARGGKVKAQKVGRSWYVAEDSLAAYLGSEKAEASAVKIKEPEEEEMEIAEPEKETPAEEDAEKIEEEKEEVTEEKIIEEETIEELVVEEPEKEERVISLHKKAEVKIEEKKAEASRTPAKEEGVLLKYIPDEDEDPFAGKRPASGTVAIRKIEEKGEAEEQADEKPVKKEEKKIRHDDEEGKETALFNPAAKPVKRRARFVVPRAVLLGVIGIAALSTTLYVGIVVAYSVSFGG